MNAFLSKIFRILHPKKLFCLLLVLFGILCMPSCKKSTDYLAYASEIRSNIFIGKADGFLLRAHAVKREQPYLADGIPRDSVPLCEIFLTAPSGDKDCEISFTVDGKKYGGDMSYDGVKAEYYFSCTLDISSLQAIDFSLAFGEETLVVCAQSVVDSSVLTPKVVIERLAVEYKALFDRLTDDYGFQGEIYIRLIFEDSPYYFVGIIERDETTTAFLINAVTGKVLACREK